MRSTQASRERRRKAEEVCSRSCRCSEANEAQMKFVGVSFLYRVCSDLFVTENVLPSSDVHAHSVECWALCKSL